MMVRTSTNAAGSKSSRATGHQPSTRRTPPAARAASHSPPMANFGMPNPSATATRQPGVTRSSRRALRILLMSGRCSAAVLAKDGDAACGGGAADVVGEADACAVDLVVRLAAQLLEDLDALRHAGRTRRMALGLEAAAGVDRLPAAHVVVAGLDESVAFEAWGEAQILVGDQLDAGEAVVHLGAIDVRRAQARHRIRLPGRLDGAWEGGHVALVLVHDAVDAEAEAPYPGRTVGISGNQFLGREDDAGRAVGLGRTVLEAEGLGHHRGVERLLHGDF